MHSRKAGKLRIAYLTSCRELAKENIGADLTGGRPYRVGSLESLINDLHRDLPLASVYELALVACDDTDEEYEAAWKLRALWPIGLEVSREEKKVLVGELSARIPSDWRKMRAGSSNRLGNKSLFEQKLVETFTASRIDVIVSDSYMCVMGPDLLRAFDQRVINIHPGIIDRSDGACILGPFPTRDALTRAQFGYIIIDDKRLSGVPEGPVVIVNYQGRTRRAVLVPKVNRTGVSVQYVTPELDAGIVIATESYSFDPEHITEDELRGRNYQLKCRLLPQALLSIAGEMQAPLSVNGRWDSVSVNREGNKMF